MYVCMATKHPIAVPDQAADLVSVDPSSQDRTAAQLNSSFPRMSSSHEEQEL